MKRITTTLLAAALVSALALAGCSAKSGTDIKGGAQKMKSALANVQKAVDAGDEAKAKSGATELEEAWEKFEDAVKEKDKEAYEKIEKPLGAIEAGVKVSPLDKKALGDQIKELDGLLGNLAK